MKPLVRCWSLGLVLSLSGCAPEHQPTSPGPELSSNRAPHASANYAEVAAVPSPWTDPIDVTLPNADIVSGTVLVGEESAELRAQFVATPFPPTATQTLVWGFDLDQNPATGTVIGRAPGADAAITVWHTPDRPLSIDFRRAGLILGLDANRVSVARTNIVTVCIPSFLLRGDEGFHYIVESAFGGSFGANDDAPAAWDFGAPSGSFLNEVGSTFPCGLSVAEACELVGHAVDEECPCGQGRRGEYLSCVTRAARSALQELEGVLTQEERAEVLRCVVRTRLESGCVPRETDDGPRSDKIPVGRQSGTTSD